ncbi:MAG: hypothetical protein ACKPKO_43880, partial [Candidatus Fonsibacter sp.]
VDDKVVVYLGCRHIISSVKLVAGHVVTTTMAYDMEDFLRSCLERYQKVDPSASSLRNYVTPFLAEDHRNAPAGKPGKGPVKACPWCLYTGSPSSFLTYSSVDKLPTRRRSKAETSVADHVDGGESASTNDGSHDDVGTLASVACSLLKKVFLGCPPCSP